MNAFEPVFGERPLPRSIYTGFSRESLYLKMRDGVLLAADLRLPRPLPSGAKLPAILLQSRYWRAVELNPPLKWLIRPEDINPYSRGFDRLFTGQGYVLVKVDVRGTGASFGCWEYPWSAESLRDSYEIVEWIVSQPWSNGRVAGMGVSYLGTAAELLAAIGHRAVKAAAVLFNHPDAYSDVAFPGGLFNERFVRAWGEMDEILDRNQIPRELGSLARWLVRGVRPVAGQEALLEAAVREHCANGSIYQLANRLTYLDQQFPEIGGSMAQLLVENHLDKIRDSGAAIYGQGSWMDAGTAEAVIRRFLSLDSARTAVIGAWDHGGERNASPHRPGTRPGSPALRNQRIEILAFFDSILKPDAPELPHSGEKILHYYTMGEERWKATSGWPPDGMRPHRWYLGEDGSLMRQMPVAAGSDSFEVDFQASSGLTNRWWALGASYNQSVMYPSRSEAARHMQIYMTPPLARDLEISGHPVVKLFAASSETDGAFFVYLEEVEPSGQVRYITEGLLRALHRRVSDNPGPYKYLVPYHSFRKADALPLVPGEPAELHFGLLPTSVLVRKGSRLRLGIAGHDRGTFKRVPANGQPIIKIFYGSEHPSWIEFPAAER